MEWCLCLNVEGDVGECDGGFSTQEPNRPDEELYAVVLENGGAKLDHGSGGIVLLRAA